MAESAEFVDIPEVTETVVVEEQVAAPVVEKVEVKTETKADVVSRFAFLRAPRVLLSTAAAIVLFIFAAIYFDLLGGIQSMNFTQSSQEQTVTQSGNTSSTENNFQIVSQQQREQQVARQEAQMQKFQAQVQQQKTRSEEFKAQAEQRAQQSWERYLASLPPAQAQQVMQQREFANKQIADAKARHTEFLRQHKARVAARSGNRFGS